jgi:hypothetical protein
MDVKFKTVEELMELAGDRKGWSRALGEGAAAGVGAVQA